MNAEVHILQMKLSFWIGTNPPLSSSGEALTVSIQQQGVHEDGVISLQSHDADTTDAAAVTEALPWYYIDIVSVKGHFWLLATAHILPANL